MFPYPTLKFMALFEILLQHSIRNISAIFDKLVQYLKN